MNLATVIEMAGQGYGDRIAVTDGETQLSYAELLARAAKRAAWLQGQAAEVGSEHVAYLGLGGITFVECLLGAAWAGLPFIPLNYRTKAAELSPLLDPFRPALVVHDERYGETAAACGRSGDRLLVTATRVDAEPLAGYPLDGDAVAIILHTSGTTSRPKAVLLRHRHLCSYIFGTVEFGASAADEAALVCVPPYHIAGVMGVLTPIYSGRRIVFMARFSPQEWLRVARDQAVTHAFVVPTMLSRILDELAANPHARPDSLRHVAYGGGPIHLAVVERALALLPEVDFVNAYGLTETSSTVALLSPSDHREAVASSDPAVRARLGSVGRPLPGVDVRILDEHGHDAPPGQVGVVTIAGAQVSAHYHGSDAPPARFATGDLGYKDEGGYLFVAGRSDDVIVRGGENISPGEIEDALARHPAVSAAAVVGVPDEEWGQRVVAFLEPQGGLRAESDDLTAFARQSLAGFKVPEEFVFVDELPRTDTGKVLRTRLRREYAGERA